MSITLDNAARVVESRPYTAFGDELTSSGTGARTSYIGRETDNESDLGFYGVRLYDPTYGRFLSTDPLWSKYLPLQSYQYAGNSPVMMLDDGGKEIVPVNLTQEQLNTLQGFITTLKNANDPYINQVMDYAEGCGSTIHVYAFSRDPDPSSLTRSVHGYGASVESFWNKEPNDSRIGATIQTKGMKLAGIADVVLASDEVLSKNVVGQALLAVLDEFHHVLNGRFLEGSNNDHLKLFRHLLTEVSAGRLVLPNVTSELLRQIVSRYEDEASEQSPETQSQKGQP